ncbi:MAG: hypothetical protein F6K23_27715 [Okeania sp. SIO2C9]|uniref:hypothetical protein n=1 Tax=Okeania sp. SIO2C9 TaxID=2607791 RepID=UPI0013C15019|nr:hypothetical protein [Okeania sp. SIO2C9]NEQ76489.1 hypothetical protein [Okeania sp. SIO2C9]
MPSNEELKDQARAKARSILSKSQSFRSMARQEQLKVYKNVVDEQYRNLAQPNLSEQSGLARGFAAADLLREQNNERIDQAGGLLADAVQDVDFPGFVRDLLTGVFDANLDANERQMEAYRELLQEATREVSEFVNEIDDESAMYRLVQNNNQFQMSFPDSGFSDTDSSEQALPTITDQDGQEIDSDEIKAKILDTKLAMAQERRTLLRETLLMGISRLVVEKGTIRASVEFKIKASEKTNTQQQVNENTQKQNRKSISGGVNAGLLGPKVKAGYRKQRIQRTSQISIAASNSQTSTDLSATLKGSVEIQFKSDYFKLDNFTQIFDLGKGQVPQGGATESQQPAE